MKLPIISEDAGAKIACGRGTGNYFIISDGLSITNQSNSAKNWLECASNREIWSTSITIE